MTFGNDRDSLVVLFMKASENRQDIALSFSRMGGLSLDIESERVLKRANIGIKDDVADCLRIFVMALALNFDVMLRYDGHDDYTCIQSGQSMAQFVDALTRVAKIISNPGFDAIFRPHTPALAPTA